MLGMGGGVFECDALLWGDDGKWFSEIMGVGLREWFTI